MNTHEIEAFREQVKALTKRLRHEQPQSKGISDTEIRVLTAAERATEPLRPGQLAAGLKMTSTNMAIALRSLEQSGLIVREQDSVDKRQRFVHVTITGRQLVEESKIERHAWLQSSIRRLLTSEEQKLLARAGELMQKLADA